MLLHTDVIIRILQYTNLPTLSAFACVSKATYACVQTHKWDIIDHFDHTNYIPNTHETNINYYLAIDWTTILIKNKVPQSVLSTVLLDIQDIHIACIHQTLPEDVIRLHLHNLDHSALLCHQQLPLDIVEWIINNKMMNNSDWNALFRTQKCVNVALIQKYRHFVNWRSVSCNKYLCGDVITEFYHNLIWPEVTKNGVNQHVLEQVIDLLDPISWTNVSWFSQLSHEFIHKYLALLDIRVILHTQDVPEDIIDSIVHTQPEYILIVSKYQ
ncbi:hypothetical protein EB118_18440, partial [bacterium]|nr:hypothetical protein [bacterium]